MSRQSVRRCTEQEPSEQRPNEAMEIVGGRVEAVEVSRHPEAPIPETDLPLTDIERRCSYPLCWTLVIPAILCVIAASYWFGCSLTVSNTGSIMAVLGEVSPQGIALVGQVAVVITHVGLAMAVAVSSSWPWLTVFVLGLACEQLIAGLSMLDLNFWYSTYVVYGKQAGLANIANLGIMGAAIGIAVYTLVFIGLPVIIRKTSPLSALAKSWTSFILYFVTEAVVLFVILFSRLLITV